YYLDQKSGECRQDQCVSRPNYCFNGGTCVNSPESDTKPRCLCPANYGGAQCEIEHLSTARSTPATPIPTTKSTERYRVGDEQTQPTHAVVARVPSATEKTVLDDASSRHVKATVSPPGGPMTKVIVERNSKVNVPRPGVVGKTGSDVYYKASTGEDNPVGNETGIRDYATPFKSVEIT
ncbi:unnamed protein product, partial [Echinostoma caproni]|uniref:EGF-like domain-containing protein n=1 Tax=Echinostoma caproni TaxID=27848 RepID=A0A183ADV2_9TREM